MDANDLEAAHGKPISESIAAATRVAHSRLNKLILSRLPLTVPPQAADPSLYVSGLLHVAPIYMTFERLWRNIIEKSKASSLTAEAISQNSNDAETSKGSAKLSQAGDETVQVPTNQRICSIVEGLFLEDLMRSGRLKSDLAALTGWNEQQVEEQLQSTSETGRLALFLNHIERSVESKPHLIIAYSYIFFMALFAGGRFVRASLESVGPAFWNQRPSLMRPNMKHCTNADDPINGGHGDSTIDADKTATLLETPDSRGFPFGFFHFATPFDGEDLKQEFKDRLAASEAKLTVQEKHDIVQESVCIFENMTLLVHQLDAVCLEFAVLETAGKVESVERASVTRSTLLSRLRDSVAITRDRKEARNALRPSAGSEDGICSIVRSHGRARPIKSASEADSAFDSDAHAHPPISDRPGPQLCPTLSKSMRFSPELPKPDRRQQSVHETPSMNTLGAVGSATKTLREMHIVNWILVATFGVIFLGSVITGRRGLLEF